MSSNISWLGNKVLDSGVRPSSFPAHQVQPPYESLKSNIIEPAVLPTQNTQEEPPPSTERGFIPFFLSQNIGKRVYAEFIINNAFIDKVGTLIEVGYNYFVLYDENFNSKVMCDLYSVKFVTILGPGNRPVPSPGG